MASAVTSGVLKYSRTCGFVNQSLSIEWWEFGSDVSYTTFTGIFGNQTPYDITVEDPEEGVETKLIMDCWDVDGIYGHFFVNDEIRFFKMTKDGGIDEVAASFSNYTAATAEKLGLIKVGGNLKITQDGVLSVDTADAVEQDNTKPITSAAVHVEIGNIEVLLAAL